MLQVKSNKYPPAAAPDNAIVADEEDPYAGDTQSYDVPGDNYQGIDEDLEAQPEEGDLITAVVIEVKMGLMKMVEMTTVRHPFFVLTGNQHRSLGELQVQQVVVVEVEAEGEVVVGAQRRRRLVRKYSTT